MALDKALKCVENSYWKVLARAVWRECFEMAGVGFLQRLWDKTDLRGSLALLGSNGQCVFTHSMHGVECAKEVRAARRALFLPDPEGTGDGQ